MEEGRTGVREGRVSVPMEKGIPARPHVVDTARYMEPYKKYDM
jgi:hypothetical protein